MSTFQIQPVETDALKHLWLKEQFASIIFDYDWYPPDGRPTEETCHAIGSKLASLVMSLSEDGEL